MSIVLTPADALLVIDMQVDFLPGGALAVREGDAIVPGLNALARLFPHIILTQDWHPAGHISFASTHAGKQPFTGTIEVPFGMQTLWPEHCLQSSPGAELAPGLQIPHAELILRKGFRPGIDSYSAFLENDHRTPTGLAGYLRERGLRRLFIAGLALDFCVGLSALDGAGLGFECLVIEDLSRAVDLPASAAGPGSLEAMRSRLEAAGVQLISAGSLANAADLDGSHEAAPR